MPHLGEMVLVWLEHYGLGALLVVMVLKNCMIVGFAVPGTTALALTGFLAGTGRFDLSSVIVASLLGVLIGSNISFALGRQLGARVFLSERWQNTLPDVSGWLRRHVVALCFYQFPVPSRVLLPALLGWVRFGWSQWLLIDLCASTLFICSVVFSTYLIGRTARSAADAVGFTKWLQWGIGTLIVLWVGVVVWRVLHRRRRNRDADVASHVRQAQKNE